jgi:hypothetical protein
MPKPLASLALSLLSRRRMATHAPGIRRRRAAARKSHGAWAVVFVDEAAVTAAVIAIVVKAL